jgi:hypothetical protein
MQVTTQNVRVRKRLSGPRSEDESRGSTADELFEHLGDRGVKVHIPISVRCFEVRLHSAVAYFLSDQKGCAVISDVLRDKYAPRVRCIDGVSHWGTWPPAGTPPKHYTKSQRGYLTIKDFCDHLKALDVDMIDATDNQGHSDMPAVFFKKYGSSFVY